MKKFLLLGLVCLFAGTMSAQSKGCCASKAAKSCDKSAQKAEASTATYDEATLAAAVKAASMDENIDKKVCEKSGKVSFVQRTVAKEGDAEVQFIPVVFNAKTGSFEAENMSSKGCCSKSGAKKSCHGSKAEKSSTKSEAKDASKKDKV